MLLFMVIRLAPAHAEPAAAAWLSLPPGARTAGNLWLEREAPVTKKQGDAEARRRCREG
ncbi:MAG: hypothetical protein PHW86_06655 [Candidatus Bipolaricaulis sp.]|nr:hypothetical protein [Candidatus Bipolaricaulis sp.]